MSKLLELWTPEEVEALKSYKGDGEVPRLLATMTIATREGRARDTRLRAFAKKHRMVEATVLVYGREYTGDFEISADHGQIILAVIGNSPIPAGECVVLHVRSKE